MDSEPLSTPPSEETVEVELKEITSTVVRCEVGSASIDTPYHITIMLLIVNRTQFCFRTTFCNSSASDRLTLGGANDHQWTTDFSSTAIKVNINI